MNRGALEAHMRVAGGKSAAADAPTDAAVNGPRPDGAHERGEGENHAPRRGAGIWAWIPVGAPLPWVAASHRLPSFAPPGQARAGRGRSASAYDPDLQRRPAAVRCSRLVRLVLLRGFNEIWICKLNILFDVVCEANGNADDLWIAIRISDRHQ